jgi:hypothetical protein
VAIDPQNTYARYPALREALPPLVTKQRKHAKKIASVALDVEAEKKTRGQILQLLELAGLTVREGVTCNGYDVEICGRKGNTSYDVVLLGQLVAQKLVELGMPYHDRGTRPTPEELAALEKSGGASAVAARLATYEMGAETWVVDAIAAVKTTADPSKWSEVTPMKGATVRQ